MLTIPKIISQFRIEYKKAYKGILPDEVLAKGNKWFEDFFKSKITQLLEEIPKLPESKELKETICVADSLSTKLETAAKIGFNQCLIQCKQQLKDWREKVK